MNYSEIEKMYALDPSSALGYITSLSKSDIKDVFEETSILHLAYDTRDELMIGFAMDLNVPLVAPFDFAVRNGHLDMVRDLLPLATILDEHIIHTVSSKHYDIIGLFIASGRCSPFTNIIHRSRVWDEHIHDSESFVKRPVLSRRQRRVKCVRCIYAFVAIYYGDSIALDMTLGGITCCTGACLEREDQGYDSMNGYISEIAVQTPPYSKLNMDLVNVILKHGASPHSIYYRMVTDTIGTFDDVAYILSLVPNYVFVFTDRAFVCKRPDLFEGLLHLALLHTDPISETMLVRTLYAKLSFYSTYDISPEHLAMIDILMATGFDPWEKRYHFGENVSAIEYILRFINLLNRKRDNADAIIHRMTSFHQRVTLFEMITNREKITKLNQPT